jgi:thiamine kinase-like enzyme
LGTGSPPGRPPDRLRRAADALATSLDAAQDAASFSAAGTVALLHGDIGPGNVLWNPSPCLIDWEYTRLGYPAKEIAYTFDRNALTASQRDAFWAGYAQWLGDRPRQADIAERVSWWEPVTLLGSTLWWVERWVRRTELESRGQENAGVPRAPAYYFGRLTDRIDRLETVLDS